MKDHLIDNNEGTDEARAPSSHSSRPHHHHHGDAALDRILLTTALGRRTVLWSFVALGITAIVQVVVVIATSSVALYADTVHNIGDALTAVPLWIAFTVVRRRPTARFTYGFGRVEDLAGMAVIIIIFASAALAGYEAVDRFFHPRPVEHVWAVAAAAVVGAIGNELVAIYRIRAGRKIGSAALIADGHHARIDGLTSLAVLGGALGVWLGFPLADPIIGLVITAVILKIVWDSARAVFTRVLDGVDPAYAEGIKHAAEHVAGVKEVTAVRARWLGHRLYSELNVTAEGSIPLKEAHLLAKEVRHSLLHHLEYLSDAIIHVDPNDEPGLAYHAINDHTHDGLPSHSHYE